MYDLIEWWYSKSCRRFWFKAVRKIGVLKTVTTLQYMQALDPLNSAGARVRDACSSGM
jgi:hypothetical protein